MLEKLKFVLGDLLTNEIVDIFGDNLIGKDYRYSERDWDWGFVEKRYPGKFSSYQEYCEYEDKIFMDDLEKLTKPLIGQCFIQKIIDVIDGDDVFLGYKLFKITEKSKIGPTWNWEFLSEKKLLYRESEEFSLLFSEDEVGAEISGEMIVLWVSDMKRDYQDKDMLKNIKDNYFNNIDFFDEDYLCQFEFSFPYDLPEVERFLFPVPLNKCERGLWGSISTDIFDNLKEQVLKIKEKSKELSNLTEKVFNNFQNNFQNNFE